MEAKNSEENHDHFDEPNDFISLSSTITLETPISKSERQSLYEEITNLRKEKNELQDRASLLMLPFSMNRLKLNQKTCPLLTGIGFQTLESLIDFLVKGQKYDGQTTRENMEDQILLTIVRLKHNLKFELLSFLCGIGKNNSN